MTIATYDQYIGATKQQLRIVKTAAATTIATVPFTTLDLAGSPGAGSLAVGNTANGLVPTDATAGFPSINTFGGGAVGYLGSVGYGSSVASRLTLFDRVFHVGSVVMTSLATTTLASQPSFASRLPDSLYENLELFLEVNAAVSATATTVSVGYTNESGTTGRSTGATASMSGYTTRRLVPMPLQAGDKGVQRIDSVTVGGTVATTGSVNVVVARRLWSGRTRMANDGGFDDINATGLPIVYDTSALWLVVEADSTSSGIPEMSFVVANG